MTDHHKKRNFLNLPKYPGGNKAMREFISENVRYPQAAIDARIEGFVIVGYEILDTGEVINPHIMRGLGYGCDEESIRVISLLRFEKVKNRGLRVRTSTRTRINFRLPKQGINLSVSYIPQAEKPKQKPQQKKSPPVIYNYTVNP